MWDGETLHLIDWEGLMFAPAEADLFAFSDGFFLITRGRNFQTYAALRGFRAEPTQAMDFYRLPPPHGGYLRVFRGILADGLASWKGKSLAHLARAALSAWKGDRITKAGFRPEKNDIGVRILPCVVCFAGAKHHHCNQPRASLRNGFSAVPPTKHAPGTACHPPRV